MSALPDHLVEQGRAALRRGDPTAARESFEQALEAGASGDALAGLGEAIHLHGDYATAATHLERAVGTYQADGRLGDAARVARTLAYQAVLDGDHAAVSGWLGRARRLAAEAGSTVEQHWVDLFDAIGDPDADQREQRLRAAVDAGHDLGDPDLACDAMGLLGEHCVQVGRVAEGMALLDEALALVCAGDVGEFVVVEGAFCLMLSACETTLDVARADRWVRAGEEVMAATGLSSLGPLCRGYYGGVLTAAGRYAEAEAALTRSARDLERGYGHARHRALARLADIRVRQGRLEEADQLLKGLEEHPDAAHPLAALHLTRGRTALARERIERALVTAVGIPAVRLLALLVEAWLADDDVVDADRAVDRLESLARGQGSTYATAAAAFARGQVCMASGTGDGPACLRRALAGFAAAQMPLELALARLAFARASAEGDPEVAVVEATLALEAFQALEAARWVDTAAALLRELGRPVRVGPKGTGVLTERELEVLGLLGHGLTNPEIAQRLVISRKTAEHHVSRILMKLGLRNRAEAAAYAVRGSDTS